MKINQYRNKVVIITGATGCLGRALTFEFAKAGAKLALCSRSEEKLKKLADELYAFNKEVLIQEVDVSEIKQIKRFIRQVVVKYKTINVLVNNAGIANFSPFIDLNEKAIRSEIDINYLGPVCFIQESLPLMLKQKGAQIINISSILAYRPFPFYASYSASKAALSALTDAIRCEIGVDKVRLVNVYLSKVKGGISREGKSKGMEPEKAAKIIINKAGQGKTTIYPQFEALPIRWLNTFFPGAVESFINHCQSRS